MNIKETYRSLLELEMEEEIGYAYYQHTGSYLDYIDLRYLLHQANPYDFTLLDTVEAEDFHKLQLAQYYTDYSGILPAKLYMQPDLNVEIQHLPRYIHIPAHLHDFFEIVCILEGCCLHKIEGIQEIMGIGDITIIPPNVEHYLKAQEDCMTVTIKIRSSSFNNVFSFLMQNHSTLSSYLIQTLYSRHYQNSLTFRTGKDQFLRELLLYMMAQQTQHLPYYNQVLEGLLATFFPYLVQNYEDTVEFSKGDHVLNERMAAIDNYIRQHYQSITLPECARHFYLSPSYLSTMIKKQTGQTFSGLLQQIRMENAAELLKQTDMKVEQVCDKIGYQDTTQFIRTFRKYYGITPGKFRLL